MVIATTRDLPVPIVVELIYLCSHTSRLRCCCLYCFITSFLAEGLPNMIKIITIGAAPAKEKRYVKNKDMKRDSYAPFITVVNRTISYTAVMPIAITRAIFFKVSIIGYRQLAMGFHVYIDEDGIFQFYLI